MISVYPLCAVLYIHTKSKLMALQGCLLEFFVAISRSNMCQNSDCKCDNEMYLKGRIVGVTSF